VLLLVTASLLWGLRPHDGGPQTPTVQDVPAHARSPGPGQHPSPVHQPPKPLSHTDPFATEAAARIGDRAGTVLAAVFDIATGQTWTLGHGPAQAEASVVKLDILETLLSRYPDDLPAGDLRLAQEMIEESDNDAATSLWYAAGGPGGIRAFNAAARLTHTSPSSCVDCPGFAWPGWGLTTTTPADQISLLRQLVSSRSLLAPAQREYALRLMENVTPEQRWGVSGGVPSRVTVALKNGWLPLDSSDTDWQINSIGWISGAGRDYLMAVLSTGNPTEEYGIDTISQLSAAVWQAMR
jgi:Beta-lactamase enzyme family